MKKLMISISKEEKFYDILCKMDLLAFFNHQFSFILSSPGDNFVRDCPVIACNFVFQCSLDSICGFIF